MIHILWSLVDLENLIIHTNDNHFGYSVYPLRDKDFINL